MSAKSSPETGGARPYGLLAEYDSVDAIMNAARSVRDAGFKKWDTFTPFPVHGMNEAMGMRDTPLPWIVLLGGIAGCVGGVLLQWWTNAVDYPYMISGKPLWSLPANIPVAFETTILLSGVATIAGLLLLCDLPKYYHPTFRSERFKRVTNDRFFICIEADDPKFDRERAEALLRSTAPSAIEWIVDEDDDGDRS